MIDSLMNMKEASEWATSHIGKNVSFEEIMQTRYTEGTGRADLRMKMVRKKTGRDYRDIRDRVDALVLVNDDDVYDPFVKELNNPQGQLSQCKKTE
jgi:hypothetical protein